MTNTEIFNNAEDKCNDLLNKKKSMSLFQIYISELLNDDEHGCSDAVYCVFLNECRINIPRRRYNEYLADQRDCPRWLLDFCKAQLIRRALGHDIGNKLAELLFL